MARLSKTDAARQLGIARATLYKLIAQGKVSPTPDGLIDQAELVRVAPYIDTLHERSRTPTDTRERLQTSTDTPPPQIPHPQEYRGGRPDEDVYVRPQTAVHERLQTEGAERLQTSTDTLVDILREQLRLMQEREREHARLYEAREHAYREHIAQLTTMLDQAHQQNQRLLDMPRSTVPPQSSRETRQDASGAPQPPRQVQRPPTRHSAPGVTRGTPQAAGPYYPVVALARMQALQGQGMSLAQIAATLTAEGIPTRQGRPWHKGTVGYLLQQGT
jgi:hypothetical protein